MKCRLLLMLLSCLLLLSGLTGCRTIEPADPYAVMIPEEEPIPVLTAEPEPEPDRPRRRWFGRKAEEPAVEADAEVQAASEPETTLVDPASLPDKYLLRVGDQLQIHITGSGLDEQLEMPVDENGMVKFRFIGSVRAAGRTLAELEREIELEYTDRQKIYREVFVRVNVPYTFYFIGGEVRQPGRYPISGRVTLSQAIVAAGNFTEWARRDGRLILVRNDERNVIVFRDILQDPSRDIELRTGDVITVERSFL